MPSDGDHAALIQLVAQHHSSARAEIIQRITNRDTALFLFLAGSATLFGVSLNPGFDAILYAIPLLGLGASQVYSQHTVVIGALGRYLGIESEGWVRGAYPNVDLPVLWDNSESLLKMRGPGHLRPVLVSGIVLIALPQAIALILAAASGELLALDVVGIAIGFVSILLTVVGIVGAHRARVFYANELKAHVARQPIGSLAPRIPAARSMAAAETHETNNA